MRSSAAVVVVVGAAGCFIADVDLRTGSGPRDGGADAGVEPGVVVVDVVVDPFGAGRFAAVARVGDELLIGPGPAGDDVLRWIDGAPPERLTLRFLADVVGHVPVNATSSASIGRSGCAPGTASCGPDGEDGRGLFTGVRVNGADALLLTGARQAGDLNYVYAGAVDGSELVLRYLDVSDVLPSKAHTVSAAHVFQDRVYVGLPDSGGDGPGLAMIAVLPESPGADLDESQPCEATSSTACDLQGGLLPALGGPIPLAMIDAIASFGGRLYVGNHAGIARATVERPAAVGANPAHWIDVTPSSSAWLTRASVITARIADLEPADRAIAGFASTAGRFLLARNTTDGPQLFTCAPASIVQATCESADWTIIDDDDDGLTRFGSGASIRISVLLEKDGVVYVGLDHPAGARLFQTTDGQTFRGHEGCDAVDVGCAGIGGAGFGTGRPLFLSAAVAADGALFFVLGDGVGPPDVAQIRIPD
ncbi:MAG: hypothetical protein Q8O67_08205 [Deltaproteobacteria bacterium]|nr:hypothetical protein [Deltaproteobacteria bacterium]